MLAFDFKSLYPSIIRTFNIDPLTRRAGRHAADRDRGWSRSRAQRRALSHGSRESSPASSTGSSRAGTRRAKQGDKRAVYAYKIVMNSFYGVLGTPGCRFAASALAGAITTFGQHILFWTRDLVSGRGLEVIYGDTDSLFG